MLKPQTEKQKRYIAETYWLLYYNQTLFEQGLITEKERSRMEDRIRGRKEPSGST